MKQQSRPWVWGKKKGEDRKSKERERKKRENRRKIEEINYLIFRNYDSNLYRLFYY
jgi:hypothetical protein